MTHYALTSSMKTQIKESVFIVATVCFVVFIVIAIDDVHVLLIRVLGAIDLSTGQGYTKRLECCVWYGLCVVAGMLGVYREHQKEMM